MQPIRGFTSLLTLAVLTGSILGPPEFEGFTAVQEVKAGRPAGTAAD